LATETQRHGERRIFFFTQQLQLPQFRKNLPQFSVSLCLGGQREDLSAETPFEERRAIQMS